jgi:AcrR family transcriptional regulator
LFATAVAGGTGQRLRADAARNRQRIVEAARDAFVEHGPDAPLDSIAQRAGVGNATMYRHFPERADLLLHVALYSLEQIIDHAEVALDEPDAFEALRQFVHRSVDQRIGSLCSLMCSGVDNHDTRIATARDRLEDAIDRVMERAWRSGQLRADVGRGDLLVAITQLARPPAGAKSSGFDQFVHRHLDLFLDGLRAPAGSPLPGVAVTIDDLRRRDE